MTIGEHEHEQSPLVTAQPDLRRRVTYTISDDDTTTFAAQKTKDQTPHHSPKLETGRSERRRAEIMRITGHGCPVFLLSLLVADLADYKGVSDADERHGHMYDSVTVHNKKQRLDHRGQHQHDPRSKVQLWQGGQGTGRAERVLPHANVPVGGSYELDLARKREIAREKA